MEEILIDDGSKEYSFKNHLGETFATFAFNPTDAGLLSRYDKAIEFFQKVKYPEDATIEDIVALENGIKEQFNLVCGKNVSDGLFGRYTPLTLFANGEMYCEIAIEKLVIS